MSSSACPRVHPRTAAPVAAVTVYSACRLIFYIVFASLWANVHAQSCTGCGITDSCCGGKCASSTANCCTDVSTAYTCSSTEQCCGGVCCSSTGTCCGTYCVGMMDSCSDSTPSSATPVAPSTTPTTPSTTPTTPSTTPTTPTTTPTTPTPSNTPSSDTSSSTSSSSTYISDTSSTSNTKESTTVTSTTTTSDDSSTDYTGVIVGVLAALAALGGGAGYAAYKNPDHPLVKSVLKLAMRPKVAPIPIGYKHHFFLSHKQANGGSQVMALKLQLESEYGMKCWFDQDNDPNEAGMEAGINESIVFLLFLTEGVLERPFVQKEVKWAMHSRKKFVVVAEKDKRRGGMEIGEHKDACVEAFPEIKPVFDKAVVVDYQTEKDLRVGMLKQIMERSGLLANSKKAGDVEVGRPPVPNASW